MSHFSGHNPPSLGGSSVRVAIIGGSIVATGLLGFYAFLDRKYERKHLCDRTYDTGKISTWETRLSKRNFPSDPTSLSTLRASRIEARTTPLPGVKNAHDAHHRTFSQDVLAKSEVKAATAVKASGDEAMKPTVRVFEVPTPQREGKNGVVYTKRPAWHKTKTSLTEKVSKSNGVTPAVGGTKKNAVGLGKEAKESVKGFFGK